MNFNYKAFALQVAAAVVAGLIVIKASKAMDSKATETK